MSLDERICPGIENVTVCTAPPPLAGDKGLASANPACCPPRHASSKSKTRATLFWGISGGTVLSVIGFIALALFEQYNDSLNELRGDLKHFNTSCADLVKKEDLRNRMNSVKTHIKELEAANVVNPVRDARLAHMEQQIKAFEDERKQLGQEIQRLRERLAAVEGRQAAAPVIVPILPDQSPNRGN
jgi:hypothetical protein